MLNFRYFLGNSRGSVNEAGEFVERGIRAGYKGLVVVSIGGILTA